MTSLDIKTAEEEESNWNGKTLCSDFLLMIEIIIILHHLACFRFSDSVALFVCGQWAVRGIFIMCGLHETGAGSAR